MLICLWALLVGVDTASITTVLPSTDIYAPLTRRNAAHASGGAFFVLDHFEMKLLLLKPGSSEPMLVARKGPGPGEIERANYLHRFGDTLYVFSAGSYQCFRLDGTFLKRGRIPIGYHAQKTRTGWLVARMDHTANRFGLFLTDNRFQQTETLTHWQDRVVSAQVLKPGQVNEIEVFKDMGNFVVSQDGERVFYRQPNRGTIYIYDLPQNRVIQKIRLQERYRFSKLKGEEMIAQLKQSSPGMKIKGKFPEYFPFTSGMIIDKENHLVIRRYQGNQEVLLRFDRDGHPQPVLAITLDQMKRILAVEHDMFYISFKNEGTGDMGVRRVPRALVATFLNNHPLE